MSKMGMTVLVLKLYFLITLPVTVWGQILVRTNELTVKIGKTVYLNKDDMVFRRTRRGDTCRGEVMQNDPISQRVGELEPKIFDCDYQAETIKYVHGGSPLLTQDQVKIRIHKFSADDTTSQTFYLHVKIVNATNDIVITRGLRHVIVPEFNGLSNPIDSSVIRFQYSRARNVSCTVGFDRYKMNWPLVGQIVIGDNKQAVEAIRRDCQEFLFMNLYYEHLGSPSPDIDYLPLSIEVHDPESGEETITERYFMPIYIKGALPNSPPRSSYMSMYMMDVDQFILSTIIPGILSAEDYETPESLLVYNISKPPGPGKGFFVHLDDHTVPITSFRQDDLENHKIGYQPPNVSYPERRIYEAEFAVFDSHFSSSMPIVLHIAVRTSSTNSPRVSFNTGLVLLEGQSRVISDYNLNIVDKDNLSNVRIYVTGGLKVGRLYLDRNPAVHFTVSDLSRGRLLYQHDDSDTVKDNIALRIFDGSNTVYINFPIHIIPKDDSPPYIINNILLRLNEGSTKRITDNMLLAHDRDSVDNNIMYNILQPPAAGEIIKKIRPSDTGTRINRFFQRELIKGQIYYRHFGHEGFEDKFKFTLKDNQDPPNDSPVELFHIQIDAVNENIPQLAPSATRLIHVLETDIAFITKTELQYTDVETDDTQLTYIITSPPYFVYNRGNENAGRIIAAHHLVTVSKDESHPAIHTFKQEDINHMKIAYMPPLADIGKKPRLVRFVYTVRDSTGNEVPGQYFDIDVQPVNDKVPEFITSKLLVEEGGILAITKNQLSAVDEDTEDEDLVFILDVLPQFGTIQKGEVNMDEDETFGLKDLAQRDIRYINDGSEVILDTFTLMLTDGVSRVSKVISVDIVPVNDEIPRIGSNVIPNLIVSEGSETTFTSKVLAATDDDTDDDTLMFLIIKQPKYGIIQLRGDPATKFSQHDVKNGFVRYLHSSGEIGSTSIHDSATFIVSDQNFLATSEAPQFHLNITITPVDNQRPNVITVGPVRVNEGEKFTFSPDIITAKDPDSEPDEIKFLITKQPQWGYIENIKPNPGSEKSNAGISISTFKLKDIIDKSVIYVQATHKGVEPIADEFQFYATDGKLNSPVVTMPIVIIPVNDEEPDVMLNDFHVSEGGSKIIDQSMLDAIDMDLPKDSLLLSISQHPDHGDIVIMLHTKNGDVEAAVHDFSINELHSGMRLKYRHDNSEHFTDKFALTVSDGKHEIKKVCNITIEAMNDAKPEVIKNAGLRVDYGGYAMISGVTLQSDDEDNSADELFYVIASLPRKGSLQSCTDPLSPTFVSKCSDLEVGMNFTQEDVDRNRIRYVHTRSMAGTETDSFLFVLTDGVNKRHVETFEIRIKNSRRANIAVYNKGMEVREGERKVITTDNLSASDESTKAEEIVFAVIHPSRLGQLEYIGVPLVSISSFTQLDLASSKVVYNHLTKTDIEEDSFTFTVTNGLSEAKDGEFKITVDSLDKITPSLVVNSLLEVLQGAEVPLTSKYLRADDPDTPFSNVTFIIAKTPTHGHLYNRGVYITHLFTQSDVDRGFITFESDGNYAGLDNFLFTLTDGRHDGFLVNGTLQIQPAIFSIFIKPLVNDAPKLLVLKKPDFIEAFSENRYGFRLNSRVLKAVDSDTENSQLVFLISQRPRHGNIENSISQRYVRRRFTQRDLDENSLQYIISSREDATNDSFTFRVEDSRGNSIDEQRFVLSWSSVQFTRSDLVVCENIGVLSLTVTRVGSLEGLAFASVHVHGLSASRGNDFIPSTAQQIQFEPGMSKTSTKIQIIQDDIEEPNEKLRVTLTDPVNAILGQNTKVSIRIVDSKNGECPQYLGMISKHQPNTDFVDGYFLQPHTNGNTNTIITYNSFARVPLTGADPFDNTYNTDPSQGDGDIHPRASASQPDITQQTIKVSSKKKKKPKKSMNGKLSGKGKKSRKSQKSKDNRNNGENWSKSKETVIPPKESASASSTNQNLISANVKAPQKCMELTKGLLHFDLYSQQMFKCDGREWQVWSPVSSKDQQPESAECLQGWSKFEGFCYKFINERLTWEVAETVCDMSYGAHLTAVHSKKHMVWLYDLSGENSFWIGLNDKQDPGVWTYTSGTHVAYSNWSKDGPRVKRMLHKKNCVLVNKKKQWKNKICNKPKSRLICEQKLHGAGSISSSPKRHIPSRSGSYRQQGFFFGPRD
ncbi:hypothetical protein CHS0354_025772 [Potamilus streckersoni]|uniref:C-type lectin domain-containing protein n=1 Tax=Potamilus streckersoni TaxID=2493646 RepID=A0AAE0RUF3_9BIVA|nr:hypothetical protein CHS0354_025772 [Potamilus streckersoni]